MLLYSAGVCRFKLKRIKYSSLTETIKWMKKKMCIQNEGNLITKQQQHKDELKLYKWFFTHDENT